MRVLLKLSGESLGGPQGRGIDGQSLVGYAREIAEAVKAGHQIAVVNGGGNIFRGLQGVGKGFERVTGDRMGMLATVINSLGLAVKVLEQGGVALISGGTGNPFFTTDSGAALRALETGADALLKGTRVDGVYTADPEKDPAAVKYEELTFSKALADHLKVMDATAFALCEQGPIPIVVFNVEQKGNLGRLLAGEKIGTTVHA